MKILFGALIFVIAFYCTGDAQDGNPYAIFGDKGKVLDVPHDDEYILISNKDTTSTIKRIGFDFYNQKINLYGVNDSIIQKLDVAPTVFLHWLSVDPMTSKYPSWSPYNFVYNNPIRFIDPDGREVDIQYRGQSIKYENGKLFNQDGSIYSGRGIKKDGSYKGFLGQTVASLNKIGISSDGSNLLSELQSSTNVFTIVKGSSNDFTPSSPITSSANIPEVQTVTGNSSGSSGSGGIITFNPFSTEGGLSIAGTRDRPAYVGLAHELFHGQDADQGTLYPREDYTNPISKLTYQAEYSGLNKVEWRAVYFENVLRSQMGVPLREYYGAQETSTGTFSPTGPRLLDATNQPIFYPIR